MVKKRSFCLDCGTHHVVDLDEAVSNAGSQFHLLCTLRVQGGLKLIHFFVQVLQAPVVSSQFVNAAFNQGDLLRCQFQWLLSFGLCLDSQLRLCHVVRLGHLRRFLVAFGLTLARFLVNGCLVLPALPL